MIGLGVNFRPVESFYVAEQREREDSRKEQTAHVVYPFDFRHGFFIGCGHFGDEEFVNLQREVGAEVARDAERNANVAEQKNQPVERDA